MHSPVSSLPQPTSMRSIQSKIWLLSFIRNLWDGQRHALEVWDEYRDLVFVTNQWKIPLFKNTRTILNILIQQNSLAKGSGTNHGVKKLCCSLTISQSRLYWVAALILQMWLETTQLLSWDCFKDSLDDLPRWFKPTGRYWCLWQWSHRNLKETKYEYNFLCETHCTKHKQVDVT